MTAHRTARAIGLLGSAAIAVIAASPGAQAGAFAIREQSAYGQGMSFAGMAAGGSLSSMFWNPATMSAVMGFQTESVYSGIFPNSDVEVTTATVPTRPLGALATLPLGLVAPGADPDQGDIGLDALVPSSYAAYRWSDNLVVGIGLNAPFGLTTKYDYDSVLREGRLYNPSAPFADIGVAGTSEVFSINANPNIAYQFNEYLTLAIGAQVQYIDVRLTSAGLPGLGAVVGLPGQNRFSLEGDDVAFGLTAGVQVKPFDGTEIGLGYRSRLNHELDAELCSYTTPNVCRDVQGEDFDLPDTVTLGIRQRIGDAFTLAGTVEWSNWSRFRTVHVTGLSPAVPTIPIEFGYNDGWFASLGAEYKWNEQLALRAGLGYEWSPIDDETRTFRLPDNDRLWLSAGASYAVTEKYSVDVGYTYIKAEDTELFASALGGPRLNGPFSGEADSEVHIISGAMKVKWGAPAVEAPVVAKY